MKVGHEMLRSFGKGEYGPQVHQLGNDTLGIGKFIAQKFEITFFLHVFRIKSGAKVQKKTHVCKKKCIFCKKYLVMSKKRSNFAADFQI